MQYSMISMGRIKAVANNSLGCIDFCMIPCSAKAPVAIRDDLSDSAVKHSQKFSFSRILQILQILLCQRLLIPGPLFLQDGLRRGAQGRAGDLFQLMQAAFALDFLLGDGLPVVLRRHMPEMYPIPVCFPQPVGDGKPFRVKIPDHSRGWNLGRGGDASCSPQKIRLSPHLCLAGLCTPGDLLRLARQRRRSVRRRSVCLCKIIIVFERMVG